MIVANVGILYLFPFYLQLVQGYTPSVAGLIFTSLSVAVMAGGILGGMLFNRAGGRRINIASGILVASGYLLLTGIRPDSPVWFMVLCLVLIGLGFGMLLTSASTMAMNAVPKKYQGMVSGFICLERFAPITIGIALFNIAFIGGMNAASSRQRGCKRSAGDYRDGRARGRVLRRHFCSGALSASSSSRLSSLHARRSIRITGHTGGKGILKKD